MWKELRIQYQDNDEALNIINDLEALHKKWKDIPVSFYIGDYSSELTKLILSEIGYCTSSTKRVNKDTFFALFVFTTKKEKINAPTKEIDVQWNQLSSRYRTNPEACKLMQALKPIYTKWNGLPKSFYISNFDMNLTQTVLSDLGYYVLSIKRVPNGKNIYSLCIHTSKK